MHEKKRFGELCTLLGHRHRFGLSSWVTDVSLFMQAIHDFSGYVFPGTGTVLLRKAGEIQQRQGHFIHFVLVVIHTFLHFAVSTLQTGSIQLTPQCRQAVELIIEAGDCCLLLEGVHLPKAS